MSQKNINFLVIITVIVLAIAVMNMASLEKGNHVEVLYSDFIQQLDQGQISEVAVEGEKLFGTLHDGTSFFTFLPDHPGLMEKIREAKVVFKVEPNPGSAWYVSLLVHWGPFIFLIGLWLFFIKRMQSGGGGKLFSLGRSKARLAQEGEVKTTFADVAGVEEAKESLREIIEFLRDPEKFSKLGGKIPRGVLLTGPPGTGKTLLAKAVAGEAGASFYSMSGSDFVEMFVGVGASRVRDLFEQGKKNSPCILFIDEIDAVGRKRGAGLGSGHDEREQTLNQLLVEMDGFDEHAEVITLAATNRADVLDPALLRPGRFDRQVAVPLPDLEGRKAILEIHVKKISVAKEVNLSQIAAGTPGFSGADLRNLINEAALYAARKAKTEVGTEDLEWARDKVLMGPERKTLTRTEKEKISTAYHEAGHALVGAFMEKAEKVHKVTIIPRGSALGLTSFLPKKERQTQDKGYLLAQIAVAMGGRAAEDIIFHDFSTGAGNDIQQATNIANKMVTEWGMSEKIGPIKLGAEREQLFLGRDIGAERGYGEETAQIIDEEVRGILHESYAQAKSILNQHLETLHRLASRLIEKETVSGEELQMMLNPT